MITQLTQNSIGVQVPERSTKHEVANAEGIGQQLFTVHWYAGGNAEDTMITSLPPGEWKILGLADKLTLEQCEEVMQGYEGSLYLLLKEKGLQAENILILIKQ